MQTAALDGIEAVLTAERDGYRLLDAALQQERQALVQADRRALRDAVRQKERLSERIGRLETRRTELVAELAAELECAPEQLRLGELAARAGGGARERLRRLRRELLTIVERIRSGQQINHDLLGHCRQWARGAMAVLEERAAPQTVYRRSGRMAPAGRRGWMLSNTV